MLLLYTMLLCLWRRGLCPDPVFIAFGFSRKASADAQGTSDITCEPFRQTSHRRLCRFPALYHPPLRETTPLWESPLHRLLVFKGAATWFNLAGDTVQSHRNRCSIRPVLVHSRNSIFTCRECRKPVKYMAREIPIYRSCLLGEF